MDFDMRLACCLLFPLSFGVVSGCDRGSVGEYDAAGTGGGSSSSDGEDTETSPGSASDGASSGSDDDDDATSSTTANDDADPVDLDGALSETCVGEGSSRQVGFSLAIDAVNTECEIIADETERLTIGVAAPFGTEGSFPADAEITYAVFNDGALNEYDLESVELEITQWQDDVVVGNYTGVIPASEDDEFPTPEMTLSGEFVVLACEATAQLPCE